MDAYDGTWCGGPQGCGRVVPKALWESHRQNVHDMFNPRERQLSADVDGAHELALTVAGLNETEHELALALNALNELWQTVGRYGYPKQFVDSIEGVLEWGTGLCLPEHRDYNDVCIHPGCPAYKRETSK